MPLKERQYEVLKFADIKVSVTHFNTIWQQRGSDKKSKRERRKGRLTRELTEASTER